MKYIYSKSLKTLKQNFQEHQNIVDIILTSNTRSSSFVYGLSDYNLLIIVTDQTHPKSVLREFRAFLKSNYLLKSTINTTFIPILNESEFKTDTIRSYLLRNSHQDCITWKSVLNKKDSTFFIRKQDRFAISYNSLQSLDYHLLNNIAPKNRRTKLKNLVRSLNNLKKFFPEKFTSYELIKTKKRSTLSTRDTFFPKRLEKKIWQEITFIEKESNLKHNNNQKNPIFLPNDFKKYLESILSFSFIDDITLTPTLIQDKIDQLQGKLFIDIHLNEKLLTNHYLEHLNNLKLGILDFQRSGLKFRVRFTSNKLYLLQNKYSFYPFPLEALFRKKRTVSLNKIDYQYITDYDYIHMACVHFLITQFMRFRSLEQKTDLIGSKFIKSLNLMYKYHLILNFLKGNEFELTNEEYKIREHLTPQFSDIDGQDPLTQEQWKLVKSQLVYLLKEIREELANQDSSLRLLKF